MKKTLCIAFVIVFMLSFAGCKKNSGRTFDYFGDDFSWDMTPEQAKKFIESRQLIKKTVTIEDQYGIDTIVSDGDYVFRFNKNMNMDMAKHIVGGDPMLIETIKSWYGEPDEMKGEGTTAYYVWEGTMGGKKTELQFNPTVKTTSGNPTLQLCFVPKD